MSDARLRRVQKEIKGMSTTLATYPGRGTRGTGAATLTSALQPKDS